MSTVRVSDRTHELLREVSSWRDQPMSEVLAEAIDRLWREDLLRRTNEAYAALREDPEAWEDLVRERAEWDAMLLDGLTED